MLDAAVRVLQDAGRPLAVRELTNTALESGYWTTSGKTPWDTLSARISEHIAKTGNDSRIVRVSPGVFALREPAPPGPPEPAPVSPTPEKRPDGATSFLKAAYRVLTECNPHKKPIHYRDIVRTAMENGWLVSRGQTPELSLYTQVYDEIERHKRRGTHPRFERHKGGLIGLTEWATAGLPAQIDAHNRSVRKALRERLYELPFADFEQLVGQLLVELGFEDVEVTSKSGDGGIDVRGTLVVGGVIRTRMAVQAKRWKKGNNVQAPTVQQVRGSLGTHEQGLIITTSSFSAGAREEAKRPNAVPVALMDGDDLIELLVEHEIGVSKTRFDMLEAAGL